MRRSANRIEGNSPARFRQGAAKYPYLFGSPLSATVWALARSGGGDQLAGVTSDGRLELVHEVRRSVNKLGTKHQRHLDGLALAQLGEAVHVMGADEGGSAEKGGSEEVALMESTTATAAPPPVLHVALGQAARPAVAPPPPYPVSPARVALRTVSWNTHPSVKGHGNWVACGGSAGLVIILPAPKVATRGAASSSEAADDEEVMSVDGDE